MLKKLLSLLLLLCLCLPLSSCSLGGFDADGGIEAVQRDSDGSVYLHNGDGSFTLVELGNPAQETFKIDFFNGKPITRIADELFRGNTTVTSVILGDAITSIGSSAFFGCTALREVRGARSLTKIGNYAFYGCTSLTTVPIPEGIRSLGDFCFNGCSQLNVTALPSSLTHIGNRIFGENFGATLTVYDNATYIASGDNPYYYL